MNAAASIGRVGGLAVALGIGAGAVILGAGQASASPEDTSAVSVPGETTPSNDRRSKARPDTHSPSAQPTSDDSGIGEQSAVERQQYRSPRGRAAVRVGSSEPDARRESSELDSNLVQRVGASAAVKAVAAQPVSEELVALLPDGPAEPVNPVAQPAVAASGPETGSAPGGSAPVMAPSSGADPAQSSTMEAVFTPFSGLGPGLPGQAAVSWVMVAAARRELGDRLVAGGQPNGRVAAGRQLDPEPVRAAAATLAVDVSTESLTPASAETTVDPITAIFQQVSAVISGIVQAVTGVINGFVAAISQVVSAIVGIFLPPVPVNTAPTVSAPTVSSPDPGTGVVTGQVSATDADGDTLTYSAPATTAKGSVSINSGTGVFTYTPTVAARENAAKFGATDADKSDSFTVTVADGKGGSADVVIAVEIIRNSAPVAGTPTIGPPDPATGVVTGTVVGSDPNGDPLTFGQSILPWPGLKGSVVVNSSTGAFTYTPTTESRQNAARAGATAADLTDTFAATIVDSYGATATVLVTVPISPITTSPTNSAPVVGAVVVDIPDTISGVVYGTISAIDADGDALTYSAPTGTARGEVLINASTGGFTYIPTSAARLNAGRAGATASDQSDAFTVTISDGRGGNTTVGISVPVSPLPQGVDNRNPLAGAPSVGEPNATTGVVLGSVVATDADGDPLTYIGSTTTNKGTVTVASNGSFIYTPSSAARQQAGLDTTDSFSVIISDGRGGTAVSTVVVPVDPGTPVLDKMINYGPSQYGDVMGVAAFIDTAGRTLTYSASPVTPGGGAVEVNSETGAYTFTPSRSQRLSGVGYATSTDTFVMTISNGVRTVTQPVTVLVTPPMATSTYAVGSGPIQVVVSPDGNYIYTANQGDGTVSVISNYSQRVVATISLQQAIALALSPSGNRLYVVGQGSVMSVVDTTTNRVVGTVPVGAYTVLAAPDGATVYVLSSLDQVGDVVSVVDVATNSVTRSFSTGSGYAGHASLSPDGRNLYVAYQAGIVQAINIGNNSQSETTIAAVGHYTANASAFSPDSTRAYVAADGSLLVIDTVSRSILRDVAIGENLRAVAVSPDGNYVYVADSNTGEVHVYNARTGMVSASILVGSQPNSLVVSPDGSRVYVANTSSDTVSVISI